MAKYYELRESSISWESDKAYGVDYPSGGRRPTRIFYPKSLAKVSDSGVVLMPEWIIEKKKARVADPYDAFVTSHPAIEIAEPAEKVIDASNLLAFFDNAAASVKFPKVKFKDVVLSRKGARAKVPGSVHVTDHGSYPDNKWYGMIDLDGKYTPTRKATPEVVELVEKFNADPEGYVAKAGKEMGACAFCLLELTDDRSLDAGYGPVCAKKYGLPWGNTDRKKEAA